MKQLLIIICFLALILICIMAIGVNQARAEGVIISPLEEVNQAFKKIA